MFQDDVLRMKRDEQEGHEQGGHKQDGQDG